MVFSLLSRYRSRRRLSVSIGHPDQITKRRAIGAVNLNAEMMRFKIRLMANGARRDVRFWDCLFPNPPLFCLPFFCLPFFCLILSPYSRIPKIRQKNGRQKNGGQKNYCAYEQAGRILHAVPPSNKMTVRQKPHVSATGKVSVIN